MFGELRHRYPAKPLKFSEDCPDLVKKRLLSIAFQQSATRNQHDHVIAIGEQYIILEVELQEKTPFRYKLALAYSFKERHQEARRWLLEHVRPGRDVPFYQESVALLADPYSVVAKMKKPIAEDVQRKAWKEFIANGAQVGKMAHEAAVQEFGKDYQTKMQGSDFSALVKRMEEKVAAQSRQKYNISYSQWQKIAEKAARLNW